MHRNTRATLRRYHAEGLIDQPPPTRAVQDAAFDFVDQLGHDFIDTDPEVTA